MITLIALIVSTLCWFAVALHFGAQPIGYSTACIGLINALAALARLLWLKSKSRT